MKTIIIIAAVLITLTSCGHSYFVRSLDTNNIIYMDGSEIGQDNKIGDTIRMNGTKRIDSVAVAKIEFTGVVISVDKKD